MRVEAAKAIAGAWVREQALALPGFRGALLHGSILELADDAELSASSDLDLLLVLDDPEAIDTPGKVRFRGQLLEVSPIAFDRVATPERVLGEYNLAPSFRVNGLLADPDGELTRVQRTVARRFAEPAWVNARIDQAAEKVRRGFPDAPAGPRHARITAWLFSTGVLTHVLLVGGLRNPTVRKRYLATRELLAEQNRLDAYEQLLDLLGVRAWDANRARVHLDSLAEAFEAAAGVIRSPFFFAADISAAGRAVAIDGSRDLIEAGFPREAAFWIAATWCRCLAVFEADAPELAGRFDPAFRGLLADLGFESDEDIVRRRSETVAALDWVTPLAKTLTPGPSPAAAGEG